MTSSKSHIFILCNTLSALLGAAVLFGWHTHQLTLIQIHESWVPMQYNTALGFFSCGLAGILIISSQYSLSRFFTVIPILLGVLTLAEYGLDMSLSIDEMFIESFITTKTSHPGRMAPNTALCFLLSGVSMGMAGFLPISKSKKMGLISTVGGLLVLALASTALIGYLIDVEGTYGWGSLTRMALHTSIGFVFLGIALISSTIEQGKVEKAVLFFLILILIAIFLVLSALASMEQRTQREVANTLQTSLTRTISELDLWADEVERVAIDWSNLQGVKGNINELLIASRNRESLLSNPASNNLDDILSPVIKSHHYDGYIVIAPDYTNIASMLKTNVGDKNLLVGPNSISKCNSDCR